MSTDSERLLREMVLNKVADCQKCGRTVFTWNAWREFAWQLGTRLHLRHRPGAKVVYFHAKCDPWERWKAKERFLRWKGGE